MITVPVTNNTKLALVKIKEEWHALFYEDNKQKRKNLKTEDFPTAILLRNKYFKKLLKEGATLRVKKTACEKVKINPSMYIYNRPPYSVKIEGKHIGFCDTYEEAVALRNKEINK